VVRLAGVTIGRIVLAPPERRELKPRAGQRSLAAELVKRAEVILMLAAGHSYREVRRRLDCSDEYIREWKRRFQEERLAGLDSRYRGSPRRTRTAEPRRVSWRPPVKVPLMVRPTGAAIGWLKSWGLVSRA
jgi:hypothetical protein